VNGLEVRSAHGAGLRLEFVQLADRFQHVVSLLGPSATVRPEQIIARSAEGDSGDPWPPSPPLQSLSIETLADGKRVALLVGMAGRGHWSASIETDEQGPAIVFDVACRSSVRPEKLLSCYECGPAIGHVMFAAENTPPAPATVLRDGPWLAVSCALPNFAQGPTWRWRYRIELLPPAR
jgi:hypothetical protein